MTTASNQSPPQPASPPGDGPLTWMFLLNGTRTSGGNGPGPVQVRPDEAAWLIRQRLALAGQAPPQNWSG